MFYNKLRYPLVLAVLLVAGLVFVATPSTEAVTPVLSVPDELANDDDDRNTQGIQVYGIRSETVSFELTITFQDDPTAANPVNIPVTGFNNDDIVLHAADSSGDIIPDGATASSVRRNTDGSVYTTTITAKGNINNVLIGVPEDAAQTRGTLDTTQNLVVGAVNTEVAVSILVNIVRSAAPPLTLSPNRLIGGNAPFTVTLTLNNCNYTDKRRYQGHGWIY